MKNLLENRISVSFTYPIWESLGFDATQELFRECLLLTLCYIDIVGSNIDPKKSLNLGIILE